MMSKLGLYDLAAMLVGAVLTFFALLQILGVESAVNAYLHSHWAIAAAGSGWFVGRLFRQKIRETEGWLNVPVACGIGGLNVLLFCLLAAGPAGPVYGVLLGIGSLPVLIPLFVLAQYVMKEMDRNFPSARLTHA